MTIIEKPPSRTIDELLAEGRRILAEKAERDEQQRDKERTERRDSWLALRARAREELGELADDLPIEPPDNFSEQSKAHWADFRPFGAATMCVPFRCDCVDGWCLDAAIGFSVATTFRTEWVDECDEPRWMTTWYTQKASALSEALALCDQATEPYLAAAQEAATKPPPAAKRRPAELILSDAERKLIEAIRGLLS